MRLPEGRGTTSGRAGCGALVLAALTFAAVGLGPAQLAADEPAPHARISALALSPQDGTLWIGTTVGLVRSADQGHTLAPVALPLKAAVAVTGVAVELRPPWTVYVATLGEGVLRSEDGGQTWAVANGGLTGLDVRGLAVSATDGRLHAHVRGKGVFRSRSGGLSWEWVDPGPPGVAHGLASVNIATGMGGIYLYAATDRGVVRSADCF
jgi:photosystem II stability/assembly factor-like uncharacterized protein